MNLLPEIGRATLWLAVLGWLVPMLVFRGAGQDRLGRILRSGALAVAALTGAWSLTGTTGLPLAVMVAYLAVAQDIMRRLRGLERNLARLAWAVFADLFYSDSALVVGGPTTAKGEEPPPSSASCAEDISEFLAGTIQVGRRVWREHAGVFALRRRPVRR